ncbi:hypothetical protein CC2G_008292 [Coprinopsis cinerea AmutBmut pab1-1]|nr:hypothetical protein CC2G_008292 [Coprinopsis cinerea AmutBmut pab1-1]
MATPTSPCNQTTCHRVQTFVLPLTLSPAVRFLSISTPALLLLLPISVFVLSVSLFPYPRLPVGLSCLTRTPSHGSPRGSTPLLLLLPQLRSLSRFKEPEPPGMELPRNRRAIEPLELLPLRGECLEQIRAVNLHQLALVERDWSVEIFRPLDLAIEGGLPSDGMVDHFRIPVETLLGGIRHAGIDIRRWQNRGTGFLEGLMSYSASKMAENV